MTSKTPTDPIQTSQPAATPPPIELSILPDGSVAFSALSGPLLELAAALNPTDPAIARRLAVMKNSVQSRNEDPPDPNTPTTEPT